MLDVATGTAGVAIELARRTPARVVGIDITDSMLRRGQTNIGRAGLLGQIQLMAGAAEQLPFSDASFDAVCFTYLLRYVADPAATLRELGRVLKPGGFLAGLDFFVPPGALWQACWKFYTCWLLPLGGWLGGTAWYRVGRFLGLSIEAHYRQYPVKWLVRAWETAGITRVQVRMLSLGGGVLMWGQKAHG